jgi:hypothetical protein
MPDQNRVHIISRGDGWAVKREGASRAARIHPSKRDAIDDAERLRDRGHDIVVHRRDGSIERWKKSR